MTRNPDQTPRVTRRGFLAGATAATLTLMGAPIAEETPSWSTPGENMLPGPEGAFDGVAVKDPSIVYHDGRWHVFYTARGNGQYALGYTSTEHLEDLGQGKRYHLESLKDSQGYAAAPQVFYFRPHNLWHLVYQTRDANYLPVFSTNPDISDPAGWSAYAPLMAKSERAKWIDFWVLCDGERAYVYYTREHRTVCARSTALADFPKGWGEASEVYAPVHEAVHVYRWEGDEKPGPYFIICEQRDAQERRYFSLATATTPLGPFTESDAAFATGAQLQQPGTQSPWTAEVSHGELLRAGFDERMRVERGPTRMLIQGLPEGAHVGRYENLPWRLGVIEQP